MVVVYTEGLIIYLYRTVDSTQIAVKLLIRPELHGTIFFRIEMLVRHASDGRLYLYDLVNVKKEKEAGTPSGQ